MQYYMMPNNSGSNRINYGGYTYGNNCYQHLESIYWYGGSVANTGMWSSIIIDGDAPTGSMFCVTKGTTQRDINGYYGTRYSWYNFSNTVNTSSSTYLNRSANRWCYWIDIVRKDPPKPTLAAVDGGPSTDTKEAYFEGEPVTLAMTPDYGASMLVWSAATNSSFSSPDSSVTLKSRSQHGVESTVTNGFTPADIVIQSSAAGTHYIKLESVTGRWADGSRDPAIFKLIIKTKETTRPSMQGGTGVSANGKEKVVHYNGDYQTVTFINADKNLVSYVAPGMIEESWDEVGGVWTLVLKQKDRGKYTINLSISNPAGCVWSDTKTTESLQFTFQIKEMLIKKPVVTAWPSGTNMTHTSNTCEVDYDGTLKELKISPARQEQLIIIAAGLKYDFIDTDDDGIAETCVFQMQDSGTQTITIMPNEGYMWEDKTSTTISFTFKIKAVPIDFPTLKSDPFISGNQKTVTFEPTPGWFTELVIENCPKDAIAYVTAMDEVSWEAPSDINKDPEDIIDFDRSVLTLKASNANKYVITFGLTSTNYRWKNSGTSPPTFVLLINKCELEKPKINEPITPGGAIEGNTKTIYYNVDPTLGQPSTPEEDRFFKLFVGGLTGGRAGLDYDAGQVSIRYSKEGLREDWTDVGDTLASSIANLTLWGDKAGNYLINITPTDNYKWKDGTNDMITFKFVVTPVAHDTLQMFVSQTGSTSWVPVDRNGEADYTNERKEFRIGNEKIATEYFIGNDMAFALVENDDRETIRSFPDGFQLKVVNLGKDKDGRDITILEGYATNAGLYTIRLRLQDENYAWRDGSGIDVFYTFTIHAQSIGTPKILGGEGGGGQNYTPYESQNFVIAGYNGSKIQMVISVKNASSIITVIFDPDGNDVDPTSPNGKGIWQESWGSAGYEDGIDRLIVNSINVGNHKVRLKINDPNYRWDNNASHYEFRIVVDYAEVDDIVFSYSENDDEPAAVGSNNSMASKTFDVETTHRITVTRSTDDFANTPFDTQFTFEISYNKPNYEVKAFKYNADSLVLDFYDSNVYYINIYLTPNYRWKSMREVGAAMRMIFEVRPKTVAVPTIIDEGEKNDDGTPAASINPTLREKSITYDAKTSQSIAINFGVDYRAYVVDDTLTTSFLKRDTTVTTLDKKIRYTAKSAGTYVVALTLSDTNNYTWAGAITVYYTLKILPRSIGIPDAFYIDSKYINDVHEDYEDIKNGVNSTVITPDANDEYKTTHAYTGKLQYVYLFGYAVENSEVTITVSASDTTNSDGLGHNDVSVSGITRGHYVFARLVNEYTITVEFKLNAEFGTPNCHWSGVPVGSDILPRIFTLEIEKLGIDTPVLQPDPTKVFVNDEMEYHFTYDGLSYGPTLVIEKCLASTPVKFMGYTYNQARTKVSLDDVNGILSFSITGTAQVGTEYLLTVSLDDKNEYWNNPLNPTDKTDVNDKRIYIVIDKLGIKAPTILDEGEADATYAPDGLSKKFTYDTTPWPNAMTITDIVAGRLEFKTLDSSMSATIAANGDVVVGTSKADSGTYPIVFNLKDKTNLKWDGTADDSNDITFSLIIDPIRIAKPVLDHAAMAGLYNNADTVVLTDTELEVIYYKDSGNASKNQYIVIKNFVDDEDQMTYTIGSAKWDDEVIKYNSNTCLKGGSATVGTYTVTISPKPNVGWDDGTVGDIVFTLKIDKKGYTTPDIDDPGMRETPQNPTVIDQTRTVTYILNTEQDLLIKNVDNKIMKLAERSDGLDYIGVSGTDDNEYLFKAKNAGTYTVKFALLNPHNEYLDYDTTKLKDYVTYTFIINKLSLDIPVIDTDGDLLLKDETATNDTFTAVYDSGRHGALVLNVLGKDYMTYKAVNGMFDMETGSHKGQFYYGQQVATTMLTPDPNATYDTIANVFNQSVVDGNTIVTKVDGSFVSTTTHTSQQLKRENFILIHAAEPDTYELVFTLKDTDNVEWAGGTNSDKKVKLVIGKKKIPAPDYNGAFTQAYTGAPINFELKNVYGVKYNDVDGNPVNPAFEYEIVSITKDGSTANNKMAVTGLDTTTNVMTLTATEIGKYKVTVTISDTKYTEWTSTSSTTKEFTFTITKSSISPTITYVNPVLSDGSTPDAATLLNFTQGTFKWPKSSYVTAQITFPNLLKDGDKIAIDSTLGFEVYYVNNAAPGVKLSFKTLDPATEAADLFSANAPTTAGDYVSANDSHWTLQLTATGEYNLIYKFLLEPDTTHHKEDETLNKLVIPRGNYSLHVNQLATNNTYVVSSANSGFEVEPDRAPFDTQRIFDSIIWERYLLSDPDTVVQTYTLADIFGAGTTNSWSNMTAADAVKLPFLEDNDSYGFRVNLDAKGLQGPDATATPATSVKEALQRWEVKWDGTYGGKSVAKYAGAYSVSVTIKALDPDMYSFADTTYTFYYSISKVLYDLDGLVWDYIADGNNPFEYDGTAKTVKLSGALPEGLSIASYDVSGFDRNSQISAKYYADDPTDTAKNYYTSVVFASNNPNYEVPDVNDPTTYIDSGGAFKWTVVWGIKKAKITANWTSKMTGDGSATMSIPLLDAHGEKVDYTYYRDNGDADPLNWDIVTTFEHTGFTDYMVVATLKSNPSNPETDFANNYELTVSPGNGTAGPVANSLKFTLAPGAAITIELKIDEVAQLDGELDPLPSSNIFKYDGETTYSATATIVGIAAVSSLTDANLKLTYYSTSNKFRPIPAPSEPGHYLVKVQLVNIPPDDTNEYQLAQTEFYFDIEKGDFDEDDIYWRYTHTDKDGNVIVAKYDPTMGTGTWVIESFTDVDGNVDTTKQGLAISSFDYDGRTHTIELVSDDTNLVVTTKNRAQLDAGKYTQADKNAAIASFSFNGKLWNSPSIQSVMEWEIKKAIIQLSAMSWDYDAPYVYTISGGDEKKFSVTMDDVPDLIQTFVKYETYDISGDEAKRLDTHVLTKAGKYRTDFTCKDFLDDGNAAMLKNYEVDDKDLLTQSLEWEIEVREITVPVSNGSWTEFDGLAHDLMTSINVLPEWEEYLTVSIKADLGAGLVNYDGTDEFGNELFASHAGSYEFTFSIKEGINSDDQTNVRFAVATNALEDQKTTITINKAVMTVDDWNEHEEASTVVLSGNYVSNEFVDYRFAKPDGTSVTVADVAASSGQPFVMTVYVRDEFANDISLVAAAGESLSYSFTTLTVSDNVADQIIVEKKPYVIGYEANGVYHEFTYEEWQQMMLDDPDFTVDKKEDSDEYDWVKYLGPDPSLEGYVAPTGEELAKIAEYKSQVRVNVTYGGFPITFKIYRWDEYYHNYLDVWQGGLAQSVAGDYSVSYMFKKNSLAPLCWSAEDTSNPADGIVDVVDRSPVTLRYRISFKMISLPKFENPTYTGSEIDILQYAFGDEAKYDKWLVDYGEYFDVIGSTATLSGGYTLQLKIKDIYLNTIHWDNGTAKGQPGTYTVKWKILPIYIVIPKAGGKKIVYDGSSHSVFETFEGYNNGTLSEELKALMQLAQISGDTAVNAGTYEVRFKLPDSNYAWISDVGAVSDADLQTFVWTIEQKQLDMSQIAWNYDEKDPFQYTIENGEVQVHKLELTGLPEELEEHITYLTDGDIGNERSAMGTYKTVIYFFQNDVDHSNYKLINPPAEFLDKYKDPAGNGYAAIEWNIVERRYEIPKDTEVEFDGTVREILELFGFEEGWDNYLDVKIEFKPLGAGDDEYVSYSDIANDDELLEFSMFKAFYLGNYRVEFSIKDGLNTVSNCVVWIDGGNKLTTKQSAVLTINPLELLIEGWTTDANGNYVIESEDFDGLSDESKDIFEYIIRDAATGEIVTMDDVASRGAGINYTVEFAIKEGNDYAVSKGIEIVCANGVNNPYEFANLNFPGNPTPQTNVVYWLPIPKLLPVSSNVYDGNDKVYEIENWSDYIIGDTFKADMLANHGVDLSNVTSFLVPVGKYASTVDVTTGKITIKTAGDFEILVRLLPDVNLSWYDPDVYSYDAATNTLKDASSAPVTGAALDALIDRNAKKLEISIEKASVPQITPELLEILESMIPVFEYTGKEYDLTKLDETKALFKQLESYGSLISFEGYKGTAAGDYKLIIKLTDPNSSYWNLQEKETVVVNDKAYVGYDADYEVRYVQVDGKWVAKYVKDDGKGGFIDYNKGDYTLELAFKMNKVIDSYVSADGLLDENGMPETASGAKYVVDAEGKAVRYSLIDGKYVEDVAGAFLAKYKLRADGTVMEMPEIEDGRNVIDTEKTVVKITRVKTSTDPYEIKWSIVSSTLAAPTLNEKVTLTYTGSEQFAEKALTGFQGMFMEIVEGGSGTNVGEYTAKIRIKDENYTWRDTEDEFVYVTWKIEKATVDLSNVSWKFTDGEKDYKDGKGMVFTMKDGKPVVYWAELTNLPEALKGAIKYKTNNVDGAYAGVNAGKYVTSFRIDDPNGNFNPITIPSTLTETVTWNIERRMLEIPTADAPQMIFDDEAHDLLAMLNLQDDWAEYFTITVMYAKNFTTFDVYEGHNGNPYEAYGAGAYRFIFTLKSSINTNPDNPSVVWLKSNGETVPPVVPEEPEVEETEALEEVKAVKTVEKPVAVVEEATAQTEEVVETPVISRAAKAESVNFEYAQQISDRIKKLTMGAQIHLQSFKKYL